MYSFCLFYLCGTIVNPHPQKRKKKKRSVYFNFRVRLAELNSGEETGEG